MEALQVANNQFEMVFLAGNFCFSPFGISCSCKTSCGWTLNVISNWGKTWNFENNNDDDDDGLLTSRRRVPRGRYEGIHFCEQMFTTPHPCLVHYAL